MPRNTERPLNADEQRFIRHYVRERDIEKAEKKSRLKVGEGMKFYRRPHVREDIDRRIRDIEREQAILDAKDIERKEEALTDLLDPELMKTIKLDPQKHGAIKLRAIELGYIVAGKIRQGNTEALDRSGAVNSNVNIYQSVYDRRAQTPAATTVEVTQTVTPAEPEPSQASPAKPPIKAASKIRVY